MANKTITTVIIVFLFSIATASRGDDAQSEDLKPASRTILSSAYGSPDPAVPHRIARELGAGQLVSALYRGTRGERLVALDAASVPSLGEPFAVLPSLAALMGARDRRVASRATRGVLTLLRREAAHSSGFREVVPGQLVQLKEQLKPLAEDGRLDPDVRVTALLAISILNSKLPKSDQAWLGELLSAPESVIRHAAISTLSLPTDEDTLKQLAQVATRDAEPASRGLATAAVCENALSHGVEEPSKDLITLLKTTLKDKQIPGDALGGTIMCISHFKGTERADLVDLILAHPDSAVSDLWKSVGK